MPDEGGPIDDYVRAAQASENECNSIYAQRCQFSILGLLMSKKRQIF